MYQDRPISSAGSATGGARYSKLMQFGHTPCVQSVCHCGATEFDEPMKRCYRELQNVVDKFFATGISENAESGAPSKPCAIEAR